MAVGDSGAAVVREDPCTHTRLQGKGAGRYFMRKQLKTNRKEFGNRLEYGVSIVELWTIGQVRLSISYMAWPSGGGGLWVIVRCAQFPAACFGMGDSLEHVFL